MKYCIHCGEEIADSAKFCPACGKSQETEDYRFDRVRPVGNQQIRSDNHKGHINGMNQNEQPPKPPKKDFNSNSGTGGKIMEKDKKEKIRCICFLFVSICNFIVSIVNFMDKNTTQAVTYLLLGISLLLLSTTNLRKNK